MDNNGVPVAEAIERLRDELEMAVQAGHGRHVQFGLGDITMTMSVAAGDTRDGTGKVRWWLVEAGGGASRSRENTQTLVITLRPQLVTQDGTRTDLLVGATDLEATLDADDHTSAGGDPPTPDAGAP